MIRKTLHTFRADPDFAPAAPSAKVKVRVLSFGNVLKLVRGGSGRLEARWRRDPATGRLSRSWTPEF